MPVSPSWNPIYDLQELWSFPFMLNAFRAGTVVAVLTGLIGWFVVLRRQTFAGHTLALVGFPGAAGATLVGIAAGWGYFAFSIAAALVIAALSRGRADQAGAGHGEESAVTGTVQAFALACGFLFIALYKGFLEGVNSLLFGSVLGVTAGEVAVLAAVAAVALGVLALIGRRLLFASVDPDVATARGLPVRALSAAFLVLLGCAAAEASQITGTLLVFGLLVMPAATAQVLTARPGRSLALTVLFGLLATWLGLGISYYSGYPLGFVVTSLAFAGYLLAQVAAQVRVRFLRAVPA